jgi:hypothetical protein
LRKAWSDDLVFPLFFDLNGEASQTRTIELWVDGDHLVHRLAWKTDNGSGVNEFTDFGAPITITAPPTTAK